jgi:hypothetical protein
LNIYLGHPEGIAMPDVVKLTVVGKCGATIPTTGMLRRAGYYRLRKKCGFQPIALEEGRKKTVTHQKGEVRSSPEFEESL